MSRRARTQRDKRAEAFALSCSDTPLPLSDGSTYDPRAPWQMPAEQPPLDPWGYVPTDKPVPIGPTDVRGPSHAA